jgi:DNA replication protein DnaC
VLKSLDDFQWSWPKKINRPHIQNLFRLAFVATQTNIVLIGNVGVGKTHLAIALGHAACLNGHSVLFTTAVDIINTLAAAQVVGQLKREFHRYLKPAILIVDSCAVGSYVELPDLEAGFARLPADLLSGYST